MVEFLETLIRTLNNIEVKGKDNIDSLLGCILAAERELAKINAEEMSDGEQTD